MTDNINLLLYLLCGLTLVLVFIPDREPYQEVIKQWSKLFNINIKYSHRYTDAFEVDVINNILYISTYNKSFHSKQEWLYSVAHELGHLIDYAYKDYYNKHSSNSSQAMSSKAIYNDELRAWKIAKVLLEQRSLYNEKVFNKFKNECLLEYRKALKIGKYSDG